ncbi:helix-turn-helix domain-containing protein [Aureimonas sp. AU20]|uniref:helix-turn-helix domain-containing protein n=1 Tax=Aureimonas sp. AU20 TaxID=1349819 RepID=UPI0007216E51|nr:helix-turn-helix domain-containing protein [Aureimonas sp. AU20]ALN75621.1 hypothetical protein M673_23025 [Aureimonas sp. AU20]
MPEEHSRTPMSVPVPARASTRGPSAGTIPLDLVEGEGAGPHPDFLARAAIWRDQAAGLLSLAEARLRSAAIGREPGGEAPSALARASRSRPPRQTSAPRPRHSRPAPQESRQYAQPMATTAARDDRLTPHAKAFLQVLRARCGKTRETTITKGTAGNIMSRSPRTIRRYLVDLVRFGYIELKTRCNARGLHLGLTVTLTERVLPFFEEARGLARWLAETPKALFQPFDGMIDPSRMGSRISGVTVLSHRNQSQINLSEVSSKIAGLTGLAGDERLLRRRMGEAAPRN